MYADFGIFQGQADSSTMFTLYYILLKKSTCRKKAKNPAQKAGFIIIISVKNL